MTFLDTSAAIDLLIAESHWHGWARQVVDSAARNGRLAINHIVLAELLASPNPQRIRQRLAGSPLHIDPLDDEIAARAGAAQRLYRSRGGPRVAMIADFLIGAHAAARGVPLITRDRQRFASYFPELVLIAPEDQL